jgi:ribonuclease R
MSKHEKIKKNKVKTEQENSSASDSGIEAALPGRIFDALESASPARPGSGLSSALSLGDILSRLGLKRRDRPEVQRLLSLMVRDGAAVSLKDGRFARGPRKGEAIGRLKALPRGRTIVIFDSPLFGFGENLTEAEVEFENLDTAIGGDRVRVKLMRRVGSHPAAKVLEVLDRGLTIAVGQYLGDDRGGILQPRQRALEGRLIDVGRSGIAAGLKDGQWAVASLTHYPEAPMPLRGKVEEVLGDYNDSGVDITILLRSQGCRERFPEDVLAEAANISEEISDKEIARRRDLRGIPIFTIDGADAKDFDDAISIERLGPGRWRLGVHIADVAHYVREETPIDREGRDRATSIYPLDRVVPMLPSRLSDDLCSLRPNVDRLAVSCVMDVKESGEVEKYELFESIIHSRWRLTYDKVEDCFRAADAGNPAPEGMEDVWPLLAEARQLALGLVQMKKDRGALDLDVAEKIIKLDATGKAVGVALRARLESYRLIEEFMTLCNEVVGRHMRQRRLPALYRVHEEPDIEAVERLTPVLRGVGVPVHFRGSWKPAQIQASLAKTEEHPAGHLLRRLVLRAMQKAIYVHENLGHFGLGSECYLHFTSPIRRYPDLIVHRVLKESLAPGGMSPELRSHFDAAMPELGRHCSDRERQSMAIEWDAAEMKGLEYVEKFLGESFEGYVAGIGRQGAYVELCAAPVEGLVSLSSLSGWWDFDPETLTLSEQSTGRRLRIGDRVEVIIERVEPLVPRMDLSLVSGGSMADPAALRERRAALALKGTAGKRRGGGGSLIPQARRSAGKHSGKHSSKRAGKNGRSASKTRSGTARAS